MGNKRNRTKSKCGLTLPKSQWQSAMMNASYENLYATWLASLAQMRFKWLNLPESCDSRYLEQQLLYTGFATLARENDESPILSLGILKDGATYNAYGDFVNYTAIGYMNSPRFNVTNEGNGMLIRNENSFISLWQGINIVAAQMARVKRTLDTNLQLQETPFAITAPKEKKLEAINAYKQISGYEPAVIGTPDFWENVNIGAIQTGVPYIGAELEATLNNLWHEGLSLLGIENLQHEKRAQMTEAETTGDNKQTSLRLLDALEARRSAADKANALFGTDIAVVFNEDLESEIYRIAMLHGFGGETNEQLA